MGASAEFKRVYIKDEHQLVYKVTFEKKVVFVHRPHQLADFAIKSSGLQYAIRFYYPPQSVITMIIVFFPIPFLSPATISSLSFNVRVRLGNR